METYLADNPPTLILDPDNGPQKCLNCSASLLLAGDIPPGPRKLYLLTCPACGSHEEVLTNPFLLTADVYVTVGGQEIGPARA